MGGTKIMVVKLREIIKTVLFAGLGIALLLVLIYLFIPKEDGEQTPQTAYLPGTYSVTLELNKGAVDIEVAVSESEITSVGFASLPEQEQVFYPLLKPTMEIIQNSIVDTQSLDVAVPEDSTVTGSVLISAIDRALSQAKVEDAAE